MELFGATLELLCKGKNNFLKATIKINCDIIIIIETHHNNIADIPIIHNFTNNYDILGTEIDEGDPYAGIIVLLSKKLTITHESELVKERLLNFHVTNGSEKYNISAV